jgi:hypothetical protein
MVPLTIWSIKDLQSEFDDGWKVWDPHISNLETGLLPAGDLSANARATGEVLVVEQSSNNDKGDV